MSGRRLACLMHLMGLAATLSAAKVVLSTAGVALFLAEEGPERLPAFYIVLALVAVALSALFTGVVDRLPKIRLAQTAFLATLLGAAALRVPIALDMPGAYHALLASAHIYEIVTDIVFWLVVAAYLDTVEVRRGTSFLYMAVAAGGVAGGVFSGALAQLRPAEDLLLALPVLGALMVVQFALADRAFDELPEPDPADDGGEEGDGVTDAGIVRGLLFLPRVIARYPLALLIALNALVLTVLYGLAEYLVFTVYAERFPDGGELTRFLAAVYALVQVLEFLLLYAVSRPLLGRAGPLARNLVFPASSLLCVLALALGDRLPAAVAAHLNAEAVSNAVFQPVNNTNYSALPLRFQGRVRTLADGIFYPTGLALAGVMLLTMQGEAAATLQVGFVAVVFALVFVALNVGVGVVFLPTLVRNLRAGVVHFGDSARAATRPAWPRTSLAGHLRGFPGGDGGPAAAHGLGTDLLADGRVGPASVVERLRALAPWADPEAWRAMAAALGRGARAEAAGPLPEGLPAAPDGGGRLVALQGRLVRRAPVDSRPVERPGRTAAGARAPALAALAAIAAAGRPEPGDDGAAFDGVLARTRTDPDACAAVIDAIAVAGRHDLTDVLAAVTAAAPVEQKPRGLAALRGLANGEEAGPAAVQLARELARHADPTVRAEAVALLGAHARTPAALEEIGRALEDPSRPVRRRAAEALAAHGDAALEVALARLASARSGPREAAVLCLGRIGSRRARAAVATYLDPVHARAERCLHLLRRLPAGRDRAAWAPFEIAVHDRGLRAVNTVLDALAALGEDQLVASLRRALATTDDPRTRANALEALVSLPHRRLVRPIVPLVEALLVARDPAERRMPAGAAAPMAGAAVLDEAARDEDPWIRLGATLTARAPAAAAASAAEPTEADMERVLFLKRVPLFRYLPLDTLHAVGRVLQRRAYAAGETVSEAGGRSDHFCVVESGAVDVFEPGHAAPERLVAPAWFGELMLADETWRAPWVVAVEDCVVLRLHRVVFQDLTRDHPEILLELCRLLARRVRRLQADGGPIPVA